jgi:hypothetical protein
VDRSDFSRVRAAWMPRRRRSRKGMPFSRHTVVLELWASPAPSRCYALKHSRTKPCRRNVGVETSLQAARIDACILRPRQPYRSA